MTQTEVPAEGLPGLTRSELAAADDAIGELAAHLNAATARFVELIGDFDARGG